VSFSDLSPRIDALTDNAGLPPVFLTEGGEVLRLRGKHFGSSDAAIALLSVTISDDSCRLADPVTDGIAPIVDIDPIQKLQELRCIVPPGQGLHQDVRVIRGAQSSVAAQVDYQPPALQSAPSPTPVSTTGGYVEIRGSNLGLGHLRSAYLDSPYFGILELDLVNEESGMWESHEELLFGSSSEGSGTGFGGLTGTGEGALNASVGNSTGEVELPPRPEILQDSFVNSHRVIRAFIPHGGVGVAVIRLDVDGQVNSPQEEGSAALMRFAPPEVHGITSEVDTNGGLVTVTGLGFGAPSLVQDGGSIDAVRPVVLLGTSPCILPSNDWSDSVIRCVAPPGEGADYIVSVEVAGQPATGPGGIGYSSARISYRQP